MSTTLTRTGACLLAPALAASLLFTPPNPAQAAPPAPDTSRVFEPQGPVPAAPGATTKSPAEVKAAKAAKARKAKKVEKAAEARRAKSQSAAIGARALEVAMSRAGTPYVYGASGPDAFDCSGLVQWSFAQVGKSMPRTSGAQAGATQRVTDPVVGDLVFFSNGGHVYHVGIYAGDNMLWHASRPGVPVRKDRIWTSSVFYGRVV